MAATKTFKTIFELAAKYTGGPAFGRLNKDVDKTQRNVKETGNVFHRTFGVGGRVVTAIGASVAAFITLRKAMDLGKWAFDAAKEQKKAHDIVRQSVQRMVAEGRLSAKQAEEEEKRYIALGEAMNKAGGIDAETLQVSLAGLNKYLSGDQIEKMAKGWQDFMVKIHKGAPTFEQAVEDSDNLNRYILSGKKGFLTQIGLTKEQTDAIAKQVKGHTAAERAQSRAAAAAKVLGIETGETARWMDTDAGKAYIAANRLEDLGEIMGGPAVEAQREMNIALADLYKSLQPVAELIAKEMTPAVQNLSKWLREHKEDIVKWGQTAVEWTSNIVKFFWWLQAQSESALKPIWENTMKELNALIGVWENVKLGAIAAWNGIKEIWDLAVPYFEKLIEIIKKLFEPLYLWIIKPFKDAYDYLVKLFPSIGTASTAALPQAGSSGARQEGDYVSEWQRTEETRARSPAGVDREYAPGIGPVPKGEPISNTPTGQGITPAHFANVRHHNPGAQYPGASSKMFGGVTRQLGSGHLIASFPSSVHGAASNMQLLASSKNYVGKTVGQAMQTWSGGSRGVTGPGGKQFPPNMRITPEMLKDPNFVIPFVKAIASGEAPGKYPMSEEQWKQAYDWYSKGAPQPKESDALSQATKMVKGPSEANTIPGGVRDASGKGLTPATPQNYTPIEPVPKGSSLKDTIKSINMKQRMNATGPTNVAMNAPITVNGVPTGKEYAVARATQKALRDPSRQLLNELKSAKSYEARLGYV